MKFKGFNFVRARTVIFTRPKFPETNVVFLRICAPDAKGAIKTDYTLDGEPVFGKPISIKGYSRTDMAYGTDGKVYLAHDGVCYSTFIKSVEERAMDRIEKRVKAELARGL